MAKFLECVLLRNYGFSNLNRDAANTPKSCVFGGEERARLSSQCQKKVFRELFIGIMGEDSVREEVRMLGISEDVEKRLLEFSVRTRHIGKYVLDHIKQTTGDKYEKYFKEIENADCFKKIGSNSTTTSSKKKKGNTDEETDEIEQATGKDKKAVVQMFSTQEIELMASLVIEKLDNDGTLEDLGLDVELKARKETKKNVVGTDDTFIEALDMVLFGRMSSTGSLKKVDAVTQAAHALGVNKFSLEADYFIAVDDLSKEVSNLGAAFLDEFEYNSPCFHQYFNLDVEALRDTYRKYITDNSKLESFVKIVVAAWFRSFVLMHPTGKQNATATYPAPYMLMATVKDKKIPSTYENAFVNTINKDILHKATVSFVDTVNKCSKMSFKDTLGTRLFTTQGGEETPNGAIFVDTLDEMLEKILKAV